MKLFPRRVGFYVYDASSYDSVFYGKTEIWEAEFELIVLGILKSENDFLLSTGWKF